MGRSRALHGDDLIVVHSTGKTTLQSASLRKAVVQFLVDGKGVATVDEINEHFNFNVEHVIRSLTRAGWLEVIE